NHHRGR
ncbi:hypothetical protein D039_0977B, partial [Vibrio parahaemolyticus EKP-028]